MFKGVYPITLHFKETQDGFIVYRPGTDKHSHFRSKRAAKNFISLMKKRLRPRSPYYQESARRVLTVEEFNHLKDEPKQRYKNRARR